VRNVDPRCPVVDEDAEIVTFTGPLRADFEGLKRVA